MRIGFFTDLYLPLVCGAQTAIDSFRKGLEQMGHEVFVYAPYTPGYKDARTRVFRLKSIRVIKKPEIRLALPSVQEGNLRDLMSFQLDIVHAESPFSLGILGKIISKRQHIPIVYRHNTNWQELAKCYLLKEQVIFPRLARFFSAWFSNISNAIIAPSHKIETLLHSYGIKRPIYILPTGIDLGAFDRSKGSAIPALGLRERYQISPGMKLLLFVGRMSKEKNIDFLIEAFSEISRTRNDIAFMLVGDGPHLEGLQCLVRRKELERITFAGCIPHEELCAYYWAADLFLFASLADTQGIVILEAMASGLPIVALRDDAFEGMVVDNKNGFLVQEVSPVVFARKVLEILDDGCLHKQFSDGSYELAREFSCEKQTRELLSIYEQLLTTRR